MLVIDTEVYKDYFLLAAKHLGSGKIKTFEMYAGHQPDLPAIKKLMQSTTISFNGLNFDLILIAALLDGADCAKLKSICDTIIKGKQPGWLVAKNLKINLNRGWDHIDLIEVAPGRVSLKVYGARLGCATLQDLPIDPGASISPAQRRLLVDYCANDLVLTELLYDQLRPQIALREKMGDQYGMDLRSKSDAQIAETIITSELERLTENPVAKPDTSRTEFHYQNPGIVTFETPALQELLQRILATTFTLGGNGAVVLPKWLRDSKIRVGDRDYQMGIGGLHSCEKTQYLTADADHVLCDLDVASYYPNIILQQALAPESLGKPFLDVYQGIVNRRMAAKRAGDEVTAYTLKIAVNGSFGKLGSVYSKLYAPELLIQTTITGQMCLLMLIERMSAAGIEHPQRQHRRHRVLLPGQAWLVR
jgi:DNA polymerase elongation subunit (family B)